MKKLILEKSHILANFAEKNSIPVQIRLDMNEFIVKSLFVADFVTKDFLIKKL